MSAQIQIRRDTAANWTTQILAAGEFGLDTTNNQVKVGTGAAWNVTAYLGATIPLITSVAADFNDATLRVTGRYLFATPSTMTNGPAVPIDIKLADGGVSLLTITYGAIVVQQLWTDGDGVQPQKTYSRVYDTAWRAWVAQSVWAVDAAEGVDLVARSAEIKGVLSVADGTAALPSITNTGDTNTGIFWGTTATPTLDGTINLTANATVGLQVSSSLTYVPTNFQVNGVTTLTGALTLGAALLGNSQRLTSIGVATAITDALSWTKMASSLSFFYTASNGVVYVAPDGQTWTVANLGTTSATTITSSVTGGTYQCVGLILSSSGAIQSGLSNSGAAASGVFSCIAGSAANNSSLFFIAFRRS